MLPTAGYQVTEVRVDAATGKAKVHRPFVTGWLQLDKSRRLGRPVDVAQLPDGSLLVSDDSTVLPNKRSWGGTVYRVSIRASGSNGEALVQVPTPGAMKIVEPRVSEPANGHTSKEVEVDVANEEGGAGAAARNVG